MSLARALVALALERKRRGIPAPVQSKARLHIADAVGIARGAAGGEPLSRQVLDALYAGGGEGPCGVLGSPRGLAATHAAFANSALMHILDYDDIHDEARLHPTTVTLPAALAAAQLAGAGGRDVVEAVVLGDELMCRLGMACAPTGAGAGSDWFLTQLFGYFGAALAAGLVWGLDEDALVSALGLASMQAAGSKQAGFGTGATARAVYPAFAAMGGMQACLLARAGIVGPEASLDGEAGLFRLYLGGPATAAQVQLLLDPTPWQFEAVQLKPWPCCRLSHPYVSAALGLRGQSGSAVPRRVEVAVNASAAKLCRPVEQRRRPATLQDAKYSIPWMTAFALVHGRVDLQTLNDAALADALVLEVAQRIEVIEGLPDRPGHPPVEIRMETGDGRQIEILRAPGFDGMQADAAQRKFEACLGHAGAASHEAAALWPRLMTLDEEPGVGFLFSQ